MSGYLTTTVYGVTWSGAAFPSPSSGEALGQEFVRNSSTGLNLLRLVQFNASSAQSTLPIGAACKMIGQNIVDGTVAVGDVIVGVNDISGIAVPKGNYFWMNQHGITNPLVLGSGSTTIAAGTALVSSTTFGVLEAWTAQDAAPANTNVVALAANGVSQAQILAFKD